jgi:hypothetical protein
MAYVLPVAEGSLIRLKVPPFSTNPKVPAVVIEYPTI